MVSRFGVGRRSRRSTCFFDDDLFDTVDRLELLAPVRDQEAVRLARRVSPMVPGRRRVVEEMIQVLEDVTE